MIPFQTSHQEFSSLKQSNTEANQREEVLKKLASAHDSYVEISNNLREGTKVLAQHGGPVPLRKRSFLFIFFELVCKPGDLCSCPLLFPLHSSTMT